MAEMACAAAMLELSGAPAMVLTSSHRETVGDVLRQEAMIRAFCERQGMLPVLSVRTTGALPSLPVGDDTWARAAELGVRHLVVFKASLVEWRVEEVFDEARARVRGLESLVCMVDGFSFDGSSAPFKPVRGMAAALRAVCGDVLRDQGGGVRMPDAPSEDARRLLDSFMVPYGAVLAVLRRFGEWAPPARKPRAARVAAQRRAVDQRRRRRDRDELLAVCRRLQRLAVDD